jgi:catechol 2,3-dioxygenase-like lactoylglutathione lyase family enzyme
MKPMKIIKITIIIWLLSCPIFSKAQLTKEVQAIGMTVKDMDQAVDFYTQVLSFEKISDTEVYGSEYEQLTGVFGLRMRIVRLKLGEEIIELTDYLTQGGRPNPVDTRSNDLWFQHMAIVVSDIEKAYQQLRKFNVAHVSNAPQTIPVSNKAAAGVKAFYFRDPEGHNLEIIYFPTGKGNPKWQQHQGKLFLGIDHTAIAVSSTARSLQFYQDILGLKVGGESQNYGTEQEHLNNVQGARLHISGLRASAGPGIEFLEYLSPKTGRPFPAEARADDLFHWQTTLVVKDVQAAIQKLKNASYSLISADIIRIAFTPESTRESFLVRDPDGHAILITNF